MTHDGEQWFDEAAGRLVRPYAVTRGRVRATGNELDMLTVVATPQSPRTMRRVEPEYVAIVRLCRTPQTVAEVAAHAGIPLAVTKILVGDLIGEGHLIFRAPIQADTGPGDLEILRAVLDGIRNS
ncbi:DUF742 domain-containing protein [Nocardia sp. NPDC050378]|uniref:DUF742 domain-containing protein n=1 Tax=Nocardia sp. NPDC050378 TaxID=3155400 RepID=UPI0033DDCE16